MSNYHLSGSSKLLLLFPLLCVFANSSLAADANSSGAQQIGITLEDFFTAAIDYSPRLRIAEEGMNIGSARKRAANGRLLPQIRANASLSDNRANSQGQLRTFDGERYSVQLTQVLFNWQAFSARSQAYLFEDQVEAEFYDQLGMLLTDVADKYFNVLEAQDALESIESEIIAVTSQLEQIQSYYDRQLALVTDLYQAQASLAATEAEQIRLESNLALYQEALRAVTGVTSGELYRLSDSTEIPIVENSINYWVQLAEENNHQIKAREFAVQAADKRIDERRGAYMPQVSLIVQRQDSNVGFDNLLVTQSDNTYVGVDVSIPLFAGGANRAGVSEATSMRRIAENELRQVELDTSEKIRIAYLQVQSAGIQTVAAEKLLESATLSALAMRQGFELGAVTSVDVLNALRNQFQAERDLQSTRYEHVRNLLYLKREAGTLNADDMLEVGSWLEAPEN